MYRQKPEGGATESLAMSFVVALTAAEHPGDDPAKVFIIVPQPRAYLADLLAKSFEARKDVEIIVDRRYGERRTRRQPVAVERRRAERRRPKEEVIQVVIGGTDEGLA